MARLIINSQIQSALPVAKLKKTVGICPFGAIEFNDATGSLSVNSGCKMCKACIKNGPAGLFDIVKEEVKFVDKTLWRGIAVYIDHTDGIVHPVSLELLGKARSLAQSIGHPVFALCIGGSVREAARGLLHYGIDEVFVYEHQDLGKFLIEPYANVFEDFINMVKPSAILVGATPAGRSLAPRVAARFRTGLTADCTALDIKPGTDLVQIRPAFGGNIMAQIITPNSRPRFATVRYKIFDVPAKQSYKTGRLTIMPVGKDRTASRVTAVRISKKEKSPSISDAEVIVACGRGFKLQKDLNMAFRLAELLNAEVACTRPLIEAGWFDASWQIGLSGRTVKPKLIINLGISGAVQFKAGMENSDFIVSINSDKNAPVFDVSHYAVVGDIYEILPKLIKHLESNKDNPAAFRNGGAVVV